MPVAWRWWNGRRNKGRAAGEGEGDRCRPAVDGAIAVAIAAAYLPLCRSASAPAGTSRPPPSSAPSSASSPAARRRP